MAKAFSVASWNVEHFQNREPQNEARIAFLADQRPDVIAIYEAEGADVWRMSAGCCPIVVAGWAARPALAFL